jgi:hypothetical protein
VIRLFLSLLVAVLLTPGVIRVEGVFKSAKAGVGAMGMVLLRRELYLELIPIRPNRTFYRLAVGRA